MGPATTLGRDAKARAGRRVRPRIAVVKRGRDGGAGSGQRSSPTGHDSRSRRKGESEARGLVTVRDRDAKARARRGVRPAKQPYGSRLSTATPRRERGEGSGQRSSPTGPDSWSRRKGERAARGSVAILGRDAKARARRGAPPPGFGERSSPTGRARRLCVAAKSPRGFFSP
jgi:hypothetical protein